MKPTPDPRSDCCGDPGDCSQAHLYCFNRKPKEADVSAMNSFQTTGEVHTIRLGDHQMSLTKQAIAREAQPASPIQQAINAATHGSEEVKDEIKRPDHYARFAIEPCTFIMLNELPYWAGNVVKYVVRAPHKHGDERIDIRKAIRYCEMRIEELDRVASGTDGAVVGNPL